MRNFADGSQGVGNDTADIGEHTGGKMDGMRPEISEKSDFFFRAGFSDFFDILMGRFICPGDGIVEIATT